MSRTIRKMTARQIEEARARKPEPRQGATRRERQLQRRLHYKDNTDGLLAQALRSVQLNPTRKDGMATFAIDPDLFQQWLDACDAIKRKFPDPDEKEAKKKGPESK